MRGISRPEPLRVITWLSQLPLGGFILLVYGLFVIGALLPYLVAPEGLGGLRPHYRGFQLEEAVKAYVNNSFIAILLFHLLPYLERFLPSTWQRGWTSRLFLVCSALITGVMASPHGLPQGAWYSVLVLPLAFGEYLAFALAVFGMVRWALSLLFFLALYEGWITGLV